MSTDIYTLKRKYEEFENLDFWTLKKIAELVEDAKNEVPEETEDETSELEDRVSELSDEIDMYLDRIRELENENERLLKENAKLH